MFPRQASQPAPPPPVSHIVQSSPSRGFCLSPLPCLELTAFPPAFLSEPTRCSPALLFAGAFVLDLVVRMAACSGDAAWLVAAALDVVGGSTAGGPFKESTSDGVTNCCQQPAQ